MLAATSKLNDEVANLVGDNDFDETEDDDDDDEDPGPDEK